MSQVIRSFQNLGFSSTASTAPSGSKQTIVVYGADPDKVKIVIAKPDQRPHNAMLFNAITKVFPYGAAPDQVLVIDTAESQLTDRGAQANEYPPLPNVMPAPIVTTRAPPGAYGAAAAPPVAYGAAAAPPVAYALLLLLLCRTALLLFKTWS